MSRSASAPAGLHVVDKAARGDGDAPTVVLVHGSMDRSAGMARVAGRLGDLRVLRYDRRGYQRSRGGPPATLADHVDDLLAVLGGRPGVAVGHSYGGVVALSAAVRDPDSIRAVVTYECPLPWLPAWPEDSAGSRAVAAARRTGDPEVAAEAFLRRVIGDRRWEALPEATKADRRAEGAALVAELGELRRGQPVLFRPEEIPVPVVVGCGAASPAHRRTGMAELARAIPGAVLVEIDGASHPAPISHPDAFAGLVRQALARSGLG